MLSAEDKTFHERTKITARMDLHLAGNEDRDNKQDKDVKYILYSISATVNIFFTFYET